MAVNLKPYVYKKKENAALDADFAAGKDYGWVRAGQDNIFWRSGLRWHTAAMTQVQRIFRRVEPVYGKICCGGNSFIMEKLVLILKDGTELELYIGDDIEKTAAALLDNLKEAHPEIAFGKPAAVPPANACTAGLLSAHHWVLLGIGTCAKTPLPGRKGCGFIPLFPPGIPPWE